MKASCLRTVFVVLALVAAGLAMTATGCGDSEYDGCYEAQDRMLDKIVDCRGSWTVSDEGIHQCSDYVSTVSLCQADIFVNAPCDCLGYGEVLGDTSKCPPTTVKALWAAFADCYY